MRWHLALMDTHKVKVWRFGKDNLGTIGGNTFFGDPQGGGRRNTFVYQEGNERFFRLRKLESGLAGKGSPSSRIRQSLSDLVIDDLRVAPVGKLVRLDHCGSKGSTVSLRPV
jgi:hypothetical protein